jgi:hypothetical protein
VGLTDKEGRVTISGTSEQAVSTTARAQALADGALVDVSQMAKETGVHYPVALTRTVWDKYVVPDERSRVLGHSEERRLWDILRMFRWEIGVGQPTKAGGVEVLLDLYFVMQGSKWEPVTLKAILGPDDDWEPVITILMPDEG